MATQYDIVKAYADLYYENASVKKDIIVLGFQFGPVNIRFAFKFDERGNIKNPGCLLMNDVYLLRPDVNASQKEDFLNSFGEDCYFDEDDKIKFFKFSFEFTPHDYATAKIHMHGCSALEGAYIVLKRIQYYIGGSGYDISLTEDKMEKAKAKAEANNAKNSLATYIPHKPMAYYRKVSLKNSDAFQVHAGCMSLVFHKGNLIGMDLAPSSDCRLSLKNKEFKTPFMGNFTAQEYEIVEMLAMFDCTLSPKLIGDVFDACSGVEMKVNCTNPVKALDFLRNLEKDLKFNSLDKPLMYVDEFFNTCYKFYNTQGLFTVPLKKVVNSKTFDEFENNVNQLIKVYMKGFVDDLGYTFKYKLKK